MKNTGIVYHSTERTPTVLAELAGLLPPLSGEQLAALEADLLQNGCYSPVIVNEELVIVDGHNRQSLCEKHGIPYNMAVFAFDDLLEAKQWALDTQKGRRNLDKWELGKIALKLKPDIEARAKANMSAGGGDQKSEHARSGSATLPNPISTVDTRKELADTVGLGERTMGKVMQIDEHAPAAVKEALDKKELSIHQGYQIRSPSRWRTCRRSSGSRRPWRRWSWPRRKRRSRKRTRRLTARGRSPESSARRMKRRSCWTPQRKMSESGLNVPA